MFLLGSSTDWQYRTIPNNVSCLSSQGKQCRFSRGKCLGGSSSINYMLDTRGNRNDYDNINVTGWTWNELKPYFLRYEGLQVLDKLPPSSIPYHNTKGTMKMEFFDNPDNRWHSRIVQGLKGLNFPENPDVNAETQIGVSKCVGYVYDGERMSTARGYLSRQDVKQRLKVAKNTYCSQVIFENGNVTRGVLAFQGLNKKSLRLRARKEVILSAGTVGTPQILMLSGIGPADHLKEMGIPVRSNLTVGNDMSDHVLPLLFALVDKGYGIAPELVTLAEKATQVAEFFVSRKGPVASNGLTDIIAFANLDCYNETQRQLKNNSEACELPTFQLINYYVGRSLVSLAKPLVQQGTGLDDNIVDQLAKVNERYAFLIFSPVVLQPFSRGYIRLASPNPLERPAIFPNYLEDPRDVNQMVKSIRLIEQLLATKPFAESNATLFRLKLDGCTGEDFSYWQCYARHMTYAVYHAVGTCALGRVLDPQLRVLGIQGLRVADLSALPYVPRGNTEAVAIAIGERVVDFITKELGDKSS